jgi:replicative DNA helicase
MIQTIDKSWEVLAQDRKNKEFLPTGFNGLDSFLDGGLLRKELVVLGGFTGSGKSYLAGQIACNVADKGFKTIYFSLEISNSMLISRMIGQKSNIKATRIMCGLLTQEERERELKAQAELSTLNPFLHLSDDIYELEKIKEVVRKGQYEFVIIDFIQNVMTKKKDEYTSMTFISLELQRLAKECNCCILVLSQLSNSAHKVGGLLEYKGSGGIAMVADLGFFLVRGEYPSSNLTLQLRKNRRGTYCDKDLIVSGEGCIIKENYVQTM